MLTCTQPLKVRRVRILRDETRDNVREFGRSKREREVLRRASIGLGLQEFVMQSSSRQDTASKDEREPFPI